MSGEKLIIEIPSQMTFHKTELKKMFFIMNTLEDGWSVKKRGDAYVFTKKHEGKREVFRENYLETFIHSNFSFSEK